VSRYLRGGALVEGVAAHILDRLLDQPAARNLLHSLPRWMADELVATRDAIARAADDYLALPVADNGNAAPSGAELVTTSAQDELLNTEQTAELVGLSERRIRQLAAQGLGSKHGGRWLIPRQLAEILKEDRRGDS
jgi:hypothetical protein